MGDTEGRERRSNRGCGWNNQRGHQTYRTGCPYCAAVGGVVSALEAAEAELDEARARQSFLERRNHQLIHSEDELRQAAVAHRSRAGAVEADRDRWEQAAHTLAEELREVERCNACRPCADRAREVLASLPERSSE